jgi:N-methylhydantoinase B
VPLNRDDVVGIVTGNGGGYGDPLARPKDKLRADLRDGYVTAEEAARVYGGI